MNITRDNYESFFLDFLEGNLEEDNVDKFLDFLEQNPDLKEELHRFENIHLPEEHVVFSGKAHLYKSVQEEKSALELKTIAYLEGDLQDEERNSFGAYLASHPELLKEYDLFAKTRLIADAGIKFPEKQKLYRKPGSVVVLNWVYRSAAVIVLIWGINSLLQNNNQTSPLKTQQNLAELKLNPRQPAKEMEAERKNQEPAVKEKLMQEKVSNPSKEKKNQKQLKGQAEDNQSVSPLPEERELIALTEIYPITVQLENEPVENQLAVSYSVNVLKINDPKNIMTLDQFLASRVKKAGDEGLISANRIVRTGLGFASELSGERIGYSVRDGKITSLEFESKLLAFSIPLEKK